MKKFTAFLLILLTSVCFVGCGNKDKDHTREETYQYIESNIKADYLQKYFGEDNFVSGSEDFLTDMTKQNSKYNKIYIVYQPIIRYSMQFVQAYYSWLNQSPAHSDTASSETKVISQFKLNNIYKSAENFFITARSFENSLKDFQAYSNGYTSEDVGYIASYRYDNFEKDIAELTAASVAFAESVSNVYFENYFGEFNFGEIIFDENFSSMFNVYNSYTKFLEARLVYNINIEPYGVLNTDNSQILEIFAPKLNNGVYGAFEYPTEDNYLDFITTKNNTMTIHLTEKMEEWLLVVKDIKNSQKTLLTCIQNIYANSKISDQAKKQYQTTMDNLITNEYLELFRIDKEVYYWINYVPQHAV